MGIICSAASRKHCSVTSSFVYLAYYRLRDILGRVVSKNTTYELR
jgi:hypothetical protein